MELVTANWSKLFARPRGVSAPLGSIELAGRFWFGLVQAAPVGCLFSLRIFEVPRQVESGGGVRVVI